MAKWYYSKNGVTFGPFTTQRMKQLAQQGTIAPDDFISDGTDHWESASDSPNLWKQVPQQLTDDNWNQFVQATNSPSPPAKQQSQPKLGKRGTRTPRSEMLFRMCMVAGLPVYAIFLVLYHLGLDFVSPFVLFLAVMGGVLGYSVCAWAFINVTAPLIHGNEEWYKRFRESGGDPYFDMTGAFLLVGGTDDAETAETGGWPFINCPNCGFEFCLNHDACPNCEAQNKNIVVCRVCDSITFIPGPSAPCRGCGTVLRKE